MRMYPISIVSLQRHLESVCWHSTWNTSEACIVNTKPCSYLAYHFCDQLSLELFVIFISWVERSQTDCASFKFWGCSLSDEFCDWTEVRNTKDLHIFKRFTLTKFILLSRKVEIQLDSENVSCCCFESSSVTCEVSLTNRQGKYISRYLYRRVTN